MKQGFTLKHHDHAYVERRGGWALLSHLRAASRRAEYRAKNVDRALRLFEDAEAEGLPDPQVGGLGLVVLQRALLAAEDLGGLLHAFAGADPWVRLRTSKIPDIDAAFDRAVRDVEGTLQDAFRLATLDLLGDQHPSAEELLALSRLRRRAASRWRAMLLRSAPLWLSLQKVAKATMHAFPIVAGQHILGPPPAGELAKNLPARPPGRFALAVLSHEIPPLDGRPGHISTETVSVALDADTVRRYRHDAHAALRLYVELSEAQAGSTMSGHAATVPLSLIATLPESDRRIIEALVERASET